LLAACKVPSLDDTALDAREGVIDLFPAHARALRPQFIRASSFMAHGRYRRDGSQPYDIQRDIERGEDVRFVDVPAWK
jgi:hypothetical protein